MLVILLSRKLDILFISPGGTASFRPAQTLIGRPIQSAAALMISDPHLPQACKAVLEGAIPSPEQIGPDPDLGYIRRIALRPGSDGRPDEVMVTYEPGPLSSKRELAELRHHLAQAMEAQFDAVAYFDRDDRLILCNEVFANMHPGPEGPSTLGMSFEDILRRSCRHGMLSLPPEQHEDWIQNRLAERKAPYLTKEIRQRDGRVFRLIDRKTLDGGRMHTMVDITELADVQRRLDEVVGAAGFGTWSVDLDADSVSLDARAAEMLFHNPTTPSLLTLLEAYELVHPGDRALVAEEVTACLSGQTPDCLVEYRAQHKDGHWVWLQTRGGVSRRHADGRPKIFSGIVLDISRQKTVEAELRLRAAAIMAAGDGVTITDSLGLIRDANPAAARLLGVTDPGQMIARPWADFFTPQTVAALQTQIATTLEQTGSWMGPALATSTTGTRTELEVSLTKMEDGRIVWISRDVSARNALARERLELRDSVNRAQRQEIVNLLAAGLTHDLSNLTALISHLSDPAARNMRMEGVAVMDEIHAAARQMVALMDPIRQLGRRKSLRSPTDIGALIAEAAGILQLGAPSCLTLRTDLPDTPIIADLDPMQLMQVLLNLGLNARDALGDRPQAIEMTLAVANALPDHARLETGVLPEAPFALITIRDTGSGIPPDMRAQIWEPFFTTKTLRGTGLGLFVVADIVRSAGGAIALTSEMGQGTTFFIAWPLPASTALAQI